MSMPALIMFHCVNHQLSHHKPGAEGTAQGVGFLEIKLDTKVQRCATRPLIRAWYVQLQTLEVFYTRKEQGIQWCLMKMSKAYVRRSLSSPHMLTEAAEQESQMPHSTLHQVLQKHLHAYAYKLCVMKAITPK
jgi:hypothetical protein